MTGFKRNLFLHLNRFQSRILFFLAVLGLVSVILIVLFLAYLHADMNNFMHTFPLRTVKVCIMVALPIAAVLIVVICFYLYYLTNKLFGPHDRIVKELDDILATHQKRELSVRDGDEMFEELLKRINALIRQLP